MLICRRIERGRLFAGFIMLIREFKIGDENALWEVFYSAIHVTAAADYSTAHLEAWATSMNPDLAKWSRRVQTMRPFVAEHDGTIVGYADVQPNGYIDHFYVSPTMGRRGVGSTLMQRIHEVALIQKNESLFSNVSLTARPFFERWGFEIQSSKPALFGGLSFANFQMRKLITPNTPVELA